MKDKKKYVYARKSLYQEISLKVPDEMEKQTNSVDDIRKWLLVNVAEKTELDFDQIDDQEELTRYFSSLEAMELLGKLEKKLHRRLTPSIVVNYPNIAMLAEHLGSSNSGFARK